LAEKARVLAAQPTREAFSIESPADEACVAAAQAWFRETLRREGHVATAALSGAALGRELVEDFAVLRRDATGADRVLWLHACFPSGWRPEHVIGHSFARIHARIPAFDAVAQKAERLVEALVTRGPYVRFVWTVTADEELDHHPEEGRRLAWSPTAPRGFLRVERQTTVPLPAVSGCVFLIRTYLYGFAELPPEKREVLARALEQMPPELARYKSLTTARPRALELLR
jgi:dimethylamine monooxygenase subunit A